MWRNPLRSLTAQLRPIKTPDADLTGKVVIITGANSGLGLEAARLFVRFNAKTVILGCRDIQSGEHAKRDIEVSENKPGDVVQVWKIDLASYNSVTEFCRRVTTELSRLDIVVANAGLIASRYEAFEGYERQLTVHVISTFLMVLLLLPMMRRTKAMDSQQHTPISLPRRLATTDVPHIVIVGSNSHFYTQFPERKEPSIFEALRGDSNMGDRYGTTKLLSVLIVRELAEHMVLDKELEPSVILNTLDPGYCQTRLLRENAYSRPLMWILAIASTLVGRTAEMGARTYVLAASAGRESHGRYMEDGEISRESGFVYSQEGQVVQKRAYIELREILERIQPGISNHIQG
ncbi:Short-chain dehydrogenase TIC 32, chloroplastic [Daldinia childiae]|uniref:Short-chain dehydrogenase TIC 32, chloroplastic n=1 Tax=Daldinia childiae TaxID=326645 RepID=UPI0014479431|nr:Short-chain dehydrogenase TIC 32, chloroplastic [Daldinia childiae]KAF3067449.1 Short-chain dehydrogenase TIC 32, chloroplastic [Daldinia childiae]